MQTAREKILNEIKQANASVSKQAVDKTIAPITYANKTEQFVQVLNNIGGQANFINHINELHEILFQEQNNNQKVISVLEQKNVTISKDELYAVDIACMHGGIAVAENAAIWLAEKNMGNRMLPFSTQQLWLIIEEKNIVHNMHEAYNIINIAEEGFGVFIAGPSKTADIEQSLVIGAHGPVAFTVFILTNNER